MTHASRRVGPFPLYETVEIANATGDDQKTFHITMGLNKELVAQLRAYSMNPADKELTITSDRERFGEGSYETWYAKGRTPFALVDDASEALAAIVWFGPKPLGRKPLKLLSKKERQEDERLLDAGDWHTIVFRSYPPFRGKGLMKDLIRFTIMRYKEIYPEAKLWASIDARNAASMTLAVKLGFTKQETQVDDAENGRIIMIQTPA